MSTQKPSPIGRVEFIALMGMMFATIAFSIDAMLPALPQIADDLTDGDAAQAALILSVFLMGMGLGTFFTGPLSDALGRKPVVYAGAALYIVSAAVGWYEDSFVPVLIARFFQGLGAAGPRVVALAIIRDLYAGRGMARIMSIVMMIFTLVPAFAPAMGAVIMGFTGWRGIFGAFVLFSVISVGWLALRLPETLPRADRRPLRFRLMRDAVIEMFRHPTVRLSIIVQTLIVAMLFSTLMLIQPIYADVYGRGDSFPFWFGLVALVSGLASLTNALVVVRLGMRRLVTWALATQVVLAGAMLVLTTAHLPGEFYLFLLWQLSLFCTASFAIGNLNAIAMDPMGHIAGMAASVIGAFSTLAAAAIASPVALFYDGTARPLTVAALLFVAVGYVLMLWMGRIERAEAQA